jgi:ArsR family metal-binding transcriptional regulator
MPMKNEEKYSTLFSLKLCSDRTAFRVLLRGKVFFNMEKVRQLFEDCCDYEILVYTPQMIILRSGKAETTLSGDGRILIKKAANEAEATCIAHRILQLAQAAVKP